MKKTKLKPGWKTWRFDQIAINVNNRIDDPSKSGAEYYVGLEHLDPESLKIRRWGVPTDVEATKLIFKKGDIILGRRRVYQRKLAVAEFDGICSAHAMVLRPRENVIAKEFLPFFMQSDLFMERAMAISVGSLSPTINWKTLAKQEFALPPLNEQRRIAEVLWAAETNLRESINLKDSVAKLLKAFLLETWRSHKGWQPLGDVCTSVTSGSRGWAKHYADNGSGIFIRITNIPRGEIDLDLSDLKRVNPPIGLESKRTRISSGDILISITAELGLVAVARPEIDEAYVNQHLALARPNPNKVNSVYLAWYLASPLGQRGFLKYNDQGAKAGLNLPNLSSLLIPLDSLDKQEALANRCEQIFAGLKACRKCQEQAYEHLKHLISNCVRGSA